MTRYSQKTLIIFDIDGTLLYSNKVDSECFAETYRNVFERDFPSIDWLNYPHVTDHTIFGSVYREQFGRDVDHEELEHFKERFVIRLKEERAVRPEEFRQVPGARDALMRLQEDERFALGVATGGFQKPARFKLNHLDLPTSGMHMSFADGKETREEIIEESVRSAKSEYGEFEKIVYIGDAVWDVRTTRNMAMNFVGVRWKGDQHLLREMGAQVVVQDYADYGGFLDAVERAIPPR